MDLNHLNHQKTSGNLIVNHDTELSAIRLTNKKAGASITVSGKELLTVVGTIIRDRKKAAISGADVFTVLGIETPPTIEEVEAQRAASSGRR